MEPRLFRRGDTHGISDGARFMPPSMEPRLFRRGDDRAQVLSLALNRSFNGATPFQAWRRR